MTRVAGEVATTGSLYLNLCLAHGRVRSGKDPSDITVVLEDSPARVEYSLTELGGTMCAPVLAVREWAEDIATKINAAREAFDNSKV